MTKRPASLALAATPQAIVSAAFVAFFVILGLGGGSARPDVGALIAVRLAAVALIVVVLLAVPAAPLARARATLAFAGAVALLIGLQLVPLPPSLWATLPGRARYAVDLAAGVTPVWRPFTMTPDLTLNSLLALVVPIAAALWARVAGRSGRAITLYAIAGAGVTSAALGLLQLAAGPDTPLRYYAITNADSAVGLFANRNHNAMLMATTVPLLSLWAGLGGRSGREQGLVRSWIALGIGIFLVAMAAITGSRAGLVLSVAAAAAALLLYVQLRRAWPTPRRNASMGSAARVLPIAAVVLVLLVAALLTRSAAFTRLLGTDPLDEQRAQWVSPLTEMAWAFAPVGAGFGSFDSVFRSFEPFDLLQTTYLNAAHNDLLQLAIEGGIGGLILLAIFLFWWGRRTIAAWRAPATETPVAFARAASIMTAIMMIASLFDYPLRTPIHAAVFALACCWLWAERGDPVSSKVPLPASQD